MNDKFNVGDKVQFVCWDDDTEMDIFGRGWIKEIDIENNRIIIQTTRRLIWVETDGVSTLPITSKSN